VTVKPHNPEDSAFAKVLVHGPPKQGKTHLLGTAQDDARTYPMALLNFEAGVATLAGLDIDVFDVRSSADFDDVFTQLKHPKSPYKSVGVDSITETQISLLLEILGHDAVNRSDPDQLAQQDWGIVLIRMRRIVRQFVKMLPMHVFMTALTMDKVLPRVGSARVPSLQGQFASEMPGIVDTVAYLGLEELDDALTHRVLLLSGNPKFAVGTRTPWGQEVEPEIIDPTITKLLDTLGY
jgi:hypothetical protein